MYKGKQKLPRIVAQTNFAISISPSRSSFTSVGYFRPKNTFKNQLGWEIRLILLAADNCMLKNKVGPYRCTSHVKITLTKMKIEELI